MNRKTRNNDNGIATELSGAYRKPIEMEATFRSTLDKGPALRAADKTGNQHPSARKGIHPGRPQ
jgi:nitrate/nitrite-specific signal transduction histidine kinase